MLACTVKLARQSCGQKQQTHAQTHAKPEGIVTSTRTRRPQSPARKRPSFRSCSICIPAACFRDTDLDTDSAPAQLGIQPQLETVGCASQTLRRRNRCVSSHLRRYSRHLARSCLPETSTSLCLVSALQTAALQGMHLKSQCMLSPAWTGRPCVAVSAWRPGTARVLLSLRHSHAVLPRSRSPQRRCPCARLPACQAR